MNPGGDRHATGYLSRTGECFTSEPERPSSDCSEVFDCLELASEGAFADEGNVGGRNAMAIVFDLNYIQGILRKLDENRGSRGIQGIVQELLNNGTRIGND